jgi:Holliday junction resolvase
MNSRDKGKRMEREAAKMLMATLGIEAHRSVQYAGTAGDADLRTTLEGVHFEVKSRKSIGALRFYEQAEDDASKTGSIPVVMLREDGDTEWYLLLRLHDLRTVAGKVAVIGERP